MKKSTRMDIAWLLKIIMLVLGIIVVGIVVYIVVTFR